MSELKSGPKLADDGFQIRGDGKRPLAEGYQVRPREGTIRGYQPASTQTKPAAPSAGSGVKPPPSPKK